MELSFSQNQTKPWHVMSHEQFDFRVCFGLWMQENKVAIKRERRIMNNMIRAYNLSSDSH